MTEIIVALILQLTTILGGVPADKDKTEKDAVTNDKKKTENTVKGSGGTGNWDDVG